MRIIISLITGCITFIISAYLSLKISSAMGFENIEYFGGSFLCLGGLITYKVIITIQEKYERYEHRILFKTLILGTILMIILTGLIAKAFMYANSKVAEVIYSALILSSFFGTIWICKQYHSKQLKKKNE